MLLTWTTKPVSAHQQFYVAASNRLSTSPPQLGTAIYTAALFYPASGPNVTPIGSPVLCAQILVRYHVTWELMHAHRWLAASV